MSVSMMRINSGTLEKLKLLKQFKGVKCSHQELVDALLDVELRKHCALTDNGYIQVGNVVRGPDKQVLIVSEITEDRVVFGKSGYVINGGARCKELVLLADDVSRYEGGLTQ